MGRWKTQIKYNYYDDLASQLNSHGFIKTSEQSEHKLIGGESYCIY